MFGKSFVSTAVIALGLGILGTGGAAQAQTPTLIKTADSWGAYSYKAGGNTVCYALSVPLEGSAMPKQLDHGDVYFMVRKRTDGSVSFEPQFMAGYQLQEKSRVTVTIGDKSFSLFTKEKSAWVDIDKPAVETALVAAMRGGSTMTVKAVSRRGNNTSYIYSLKGITAVLNTVRNCK